jgi:pyrroline-5-carboxylate reductase
LVERNQTWRSFGAWQSDLQFSSHCDSRQRIAHADTAIHTRLHPVCGLITSISFMTFGFLGFGKMASALIQGMLNAGCCRPEDIVVVNRHPESAVEDVEKLGIRYGTSPRAVVDQAEAIVLGTKPADSLQLLKDIRQYLDGKLLISVAAGVNIDRLQEAAGHRTRVIRAMPNTPSLIGKGATAYALGDHATMADAEIAEKIFSAVGIAYRVRESALDAVTGLSGSGPAYVFTFVEALADGGVMMGLPREIALELAVQTVFGSALMIRETGKHPAELREMVASPGGTTMAAIEILEARGLRHTIMSAVRAASERARELGRD